MVDMSDVNRILDTYAGGARPTDMRTIDKVPVYAVWFSIDAASKFFSGDQLVVMGALAGRESYWNPWTTNLNTTTRDESFGLWQINVTDPSVWAQLSLELGLGMKLQLLESAINARAARWLYERSPGIPFRAWGPYKQMPPLWGSAARNVQVAYDIAKFFGYI